MSAYRRCGTRSFRESMNGDNDTSTARVQELLDAMKSTAGSRFNAAKRLEYKDRATTRLIAVSSIYVVIITLTPYFSNPPSSLVDVLNLGTIAISMIIVAASLVQYSNAYTLNAEQHHRSALEINEIRREIRAKEKPLSEERLGQLVKQYNAVLQKYSINHDDVDYEKFQYERPEVYTWVTRRRRASIWIKMKISKLAINAILLSMTVSVMVLCIYCLFWFPRRS